MTNIDYKILVFYWVSSKVKMKLKILLFGLVTALPQLQNDQVWAIKIFKGAPIAKHFPRFWSRSMRHGSKWSPQKFQSDYAILGSSGVKLVIFGRQSLRISATPLMTTDLNESGIKLKLMRQTFKVWIRLSKKFNPWGRKITFSEKKILKFLKN